MTPVLPASQDTPEKLDMKNFDGMPEEIEGSLPSNFWERKQTQLGESLWNNTQQRFFHKMVRHPRGNRDFSGLDLTYQPGRFLGSSRTSETRPMTLDDAMELSSDSYFSGFSWFGSYDPGKNIVLVCMESRQSKSSVVKCDGWHTLLKIPERETTNEQSLSSPEDNRLEFLMLKEPKTRTNLEVEELMKASRDLQCLRLLTVEELRSVWELFTHVQHSLNQRIFEKGDPSDFFVVVFRGAVSIRVPRSNGSIRSRGALRHIHSNNEAQVNLLEQGSCLGETVSKEGAKRGAACVAAQTPTVLLVLNRPAYLKTFHQHVQRLARIKQDFMSQMPCFKHWKRRDLVELSFFCRDQTYEAGSLILKQDEEPDGLYFIKTGSARVLVATRDNNGILRNLLVSVLQPGDVFGEACVLDKEALSQFSVRPQTMLEVYRIDRTQVCQELWKTRDRVVLKMMAQTAMSHSFG